MIVDKDLYILFLENRLKEVKLLHTNEIEENDKLKADNKALKHDNKRLEQEHSMISKEYRLMEQVSSNRGNSSSSHTHTKGDDGGDYIQAEDDDTCGTCGRYME